MNVRKPWGIGAALTALTLTALGSAHASAKGRRNTAAVLGAAAAYEALQGDGGAALILGAGAVGAYSRYRDARDEERYRYYRYRDRRYRYDYDGDRYRYRRHREWERSHWNDGDRYWEDRYSRPRSYYRDDRRYSYRSRDRYYLDRD